MSEAEKIARSLSPAQRKALADYFDEAGLAWRGEQLHGLTLRMLWRARFINVEWAHGVRIVRLTPLGMQQKAALRLAADEGGRGP